VLFQFRATRSRVLQASIEKRHLLLERLDILLERFDPLSCSDQLTGEVRSRIPLSAAASMSEWATLFPSPTNAAVTLVRSPLRSRMVKMSVSP